MGKDKQTDNLQNGFKTPKIQGKGKPHNQRQTAVQDNGQSPNIAGHPRKALAQDNGRQS